MTLEEIVARIDVLEREVNILLLRLKTLRFDLQETLDEDY